MILTGSPDWVWLMSSSWVSWWPLHAGPFVSTLLAGWYLLEVDIQRWQKVTLWLMVLLVLSSVFTAYLRLIVLVMLANWVALCC